MDDKFFIMLHESDSDDSVDMKRYRTSLTCNPDVSHMSCGWLYLFIMFHKVAAATTPLLVTITSHIPLAHIFSILAHSYLGTNTQI